MPAEDVRLRIPGPTPIPPRVHRAMGKPMVNHRGGEFRALWRTATQGLQYAFQTKGECFILAGSGTAAMEAAVANLVGPGTPALAVVAGKFGERWRDLLRAYGAEVVCLDVPWGTAVDPAALAAALVTRPAEVVFLTHNESSTGVRQDVAACAQACHAAGAMVVVDAVSSLGGAEFLTDDWGVDLAVTGSQKCLMLPPGLSFLAASQAALARMARACSPRYYLDLTRYRKAAAVDEAPYTPAVSLLYGLAEALEMLRGEGLEAAWQRHTLMQQMVRRGLEALGLRLFVAEQHASPTVTAVHAPPGLEVDEWRRTVAARTGVVLSGGQDQLAGRIFRVGHMGYVNPLEMLATLAAIEFGLKATGYPVQAGAGVAAAEEVWLAWS